MKSTDRKGKNTNQEDGMLLEEVKNNVITSWQHVVTNRIVKMEGSYQGDNACILHFV